MTNINIKTNTQETPLEVTVNPELLAYIQKLTGDIEPNLDTVFELALYLVIPELKRIKGTGSTYGLQSNFEQYQRQLLVD